MNTGQHQQLGLQSSAELRSRLQGQIPVPAGMRRAFARAHGDSPTHAANPMPLLAVCLQFVVDDGEARLVALLSSPLPLLEGGHGGRVGAAHPHRALALPGGDDFDLHGAGGQSGDLM